VCKSESSEVEAVSEGDKRFLKASVSERAGAFAEGVVKAVLSSLHFSGLESSCENRRKDCVRGE